MAGTDLTVIVPTYNGSEHLGATLDSLQGQTVPPTVIVVDDGSTDGSVEVARSHPMVDRVLTQENRGVAAARNRGLAIAATRFVAFLDQDDLWHPTRAQVLIELAETTGAAAVATSEQAFARADDRVALVEMGDGRADWPSHWIGNGREARLLEQPLEGSGEVSTYDLSRLMAGPIAVTTSLMYEREAAIVAGGCATFIKAADDHVLNVNVARIFGPIPWIDLPAAFYRIHPAATTLTSPLVAPLLTLQLALRQGRALPREAVESDYLTHLLRQVPTDPGLSKTEQLALLALSVPAKSRPRWFARWIKRSVLSR
jgi:hypothetical protein